MMLFSEHLSVHRALYSYLKVCFSLKLIALLLNAIRGKKNNYQFSYVLQVKKPW